MKNILLATTGLFGAALLASAATAATPKVTIGGFADFEAGLTSDDNDTNTRDQGFRNDTEINIRVDGKTEGGLGYGAVIDLEADVTADANRQGDNAGRTFIYLEGDWGRTELGSTRGAAATQRVDASTIAAASGGINGSWVFFVNNTAGSGALGTNTGQFITTSRLPTEHGSTVLFGDEATFNANKVSYYSPRFSGFQVGVSYTPDLDDRGQTLTRIDQSAGPVGLAGLGAGTSYGDILEAGVNFEHQFNNGVSLALSLTGETGEADNNTLAADFEDLTAYAIGGVLGYQGWSFAASYGDWDDSGAVVGGGAGTIDDSDYFTLGLAYDGGNYALSATYLDSSIDEVGGTENEFENLVFGADYKLAPGLTPYAEVAIYEFDEGGAGGFDNDGTTFILGTQVAF